MNNNDDYKFMRQAVDLAKQAYDEGHSPVGAVLVDNRDNLVVSYSRSMRSIGNLLHAEYLLMSDYDAEGLSGMTMYTTLEPCLMCTGMAIVGKIDRVVYLLADYWGSGNKNINHGTEYMQTRNTRIEQYPIKTTDDENMHVIGTTMWKTYLVSSGHAWALKGMLGVGQ